MPHNCFVEALGEAHGRLRRELAALRASRERLVLAADAERRRIERELHDGLQQQLVAVAVKLQLAHGLTEADPAAARALLEETEREVQQALDDTAELARRIYPPLLEARGLGAALRAAAASLGVRVSLDVAGASYPPEIAAAVYWSCHDALEHVGAGARVTVTVRDEEDAVAFELVADDSGRAAGLEHLRDRVEALGGRLTISSAAGDRTRLAGSLPVPR